MRPSRRVSTSGRCVITTATQFAYDADNRLLCTARRMNTATFAALPADGCTLAPAGAFSADRIVKRIYDAAGQARQEVRGFGTPLQQVYATHDIGLEGEELSVADADAGLAIGLQPERGDGDGAPDQLRL